MILSFHPIIEADENLLCAGRQPDGDDLKAIRQAKAVILPQGCSEALYRMARTNCAQIFPNMDIRFDYPGKLGQILLFQKLGVDYPETAPYQQVDEFERSPAGFDLPWVIKLNWGGQGEGVWAVKTAGDQDRAMTRLVSMEATGQPGFLVQKYIDSQGRCLRVVVVGDHIVSYWRIQSATQPFGTGVAHGAQIDHAADPDLQEKAATIVRRICKQTRLQLGGFDFIFSRKALDQGTAAPLLLEINYFFGRTGLGGSQEFYKTFTEAVERWRAGIGLNRRINGPVVKCGRGPGELWET